MIFKYIQALVLILVGFTLPFEHLHFAIGGLVVTPNKAVNAMLLGIVALHWATRSAPQAYDRKSVWLVFFGVALAVSAVHSFLAGIYLPALLTTTSTYLMLFLFYFMLTFVLSSLEKVDLVLGAFVVGTTCVVVTGALGLGWQAAAADYERIGGLGGNVNNLAIYTLVALPVGYAFFATTRSTLWKGILLFCFLVTLAGLANTLSRAAFVAVPFMLLLWMVRFGRLDLIRYAIPAFALLGAGAFFLPEEVQDRITTLSPDRIQEDSSAFSRIVQIKWGMVAFLSNPILGVGFFRFMQWSLEEGIPSHNVIHSTYVSLLAENGLLAIIPIVVVTVMTWGDYSRARLLARRMRGHKDALLRRIEFRAVMLQVGFLGTLIAVQFHPAMNHKAMWVLFAFSTAMVRLARTRALELSKEAEPEEEPAWGPLHPGLEPAGAASYSRFPR